LNFPSPRDPQLRPADNNESSCPELAEPPPDGFERVRLRADLTILAKLSGVMYFPVQPRRR
jgi:hypothetical protein